MRTVYEILRAKRAGQELPKEEIAARVFCKFIIWCWQPDYARDGYEHEGETYFIYQSVEAFEAKK